MLGAATQGMGQGSSAAACSFDDVDAEHERFSVWKARRQISPIADLTAAVREVYVPSLHDSVCTL